VLVPVVVLDSVLSSLLQSDHRSDMEKATERMQRNNKFLDAEIDSACIHEYEQRKAKYCTCADRDCACCCATPRSLLISSICTQIVSDVEEQECTSGGEGRT
jgi:hypothetical protein